MSHAYEVGTKAWQPDSTEGWVASEVEQKIVDGENVKLVFALENGEVCCHLHIGVRPGEMGQHTDNATRAEQNDRDDTCRAQRQQCFPSSAYEPFNFGGQR